MDNQHRQIKGYRELDESEIKAMNMIKEGANAVGDMIKTMECVSELDQRWIAIAKTDLQKGFMALTRAIAKPTFF